MVKFPFVTFDCYGTLIDWRGGLELTLGGLLRSKGMRDSVAVYPIYLKLEAEEEAMYKPYREVLRDTAVTVAKHFGITLADDEAMGFADSISNWKPFPDTVEVLNALGKRGCKRVILSNIDRDLLRKTIVKNGLPVDGYITAEDVGSYKPAAGHWRRFFEEYEVSRQQTLHVAQSVYHDIIPSRKLGIVTVWINRYNDPTPSGVEPSYTMPDLTALPDIV